MNHIDRLLRRALALPRDSAKPLFDPFDQTAPLPLDATAPLHVARAAEHLAPAQTVPAVPRDATPPTPTAPARVASAPVAPAAGTAPAAPIAAASLLPAATPAPVAPQPEATPLARADAFMRGLGARLPEVLPTVDAVPVPSAQAVAPRLPTPVHSAPASRSSPREPANARPSLPGRPNAPAPAFARASAPAASPAPAPARRPPAAPAPERVVERTVVVSASSTRLDDLAHAGRIVRFGIGQG